MFKLVKVVFVAVAVLFAGQTMAEGKIAVVDLQRAILETDAAKARLESLRQDADYVANTKLVEDIQAEGQKLLDQLKKDGAVMSEDKKAAQQAKLQEKQADLQHVATKLQGAEEQLMRTLFGEYRQRALAITQEIVQQDGIGLLLNSQAALHADTSFDITAKITQALNAK